MSERARRWLWLAGCIVATSLAGCNKSDDGARTKPTASKPSAADGDPSEAATPETDDRAHRVVFGDRTSQGYLLLFEGPIKPEVPSREELVRLVKQSFPDHETDEEVRLLIELIQTQPHATAEAGGADDPGALELDGIVDPKQDLLGFHIEVLQVDDELIPRAAREDDILLRGLTPAERMSLDQRKWALLMRADYRNMHAARGLRLLQTLVRIVAEREHALIHDPDTLETVGPARFAERRLQGSMGNVADQITVVPFPDPRHEGKARLTTRGMRRFGSVDLELDGLRPDPALLQRATDLLLGLAFVMIKEGEYDPSGFAIELDDTVTIHWRDAERAYAGREGSLPRCESCPEEVLVHLVKREREPQDPREHVVARVVAPRQTSDAPDYDHSAWVEKAIARVFGSPAGG